VKSIVIHAARDLRIEDTEPESPGPGQVEVRVEAGGICGSDLHYFNHGGFGAIRLKEPMILGHEIAGTISVLGADVTGFAVGDRVAISPSKPCSACQYCLKGQQNQCLDMRFYGSAMRMPHVQGAFRQRLVAEDFQCHKIAEGVTMNEAAFAEPFAVTLHAVNRAGSLLGKRVLVTGCGPIGALCILAARAHGAKEIIATDVMDGALAKARLIGADHTINVADNPDGMADYAPNKGSIDVMFEASGNERAVRAGLDVLSPRGVLMQLGLGGDVSIPQNVIVAKEIEIRGSFRFHEEFALAVDLINRRRVDVSPLLTDIFDMKDAVKAFETANDRSRSMKVQLSFA
jgi:L-idonate 5-dehydrogenase